MNKTEDRPGIRFNPTISFDGVAIILACILAAMAWGRLSQQVSTLAETSREHAAQLQTLSSTTATLAAIVHNNQDARPMHP